MNKQRIDTMITTAYKVLGSTGIAVNGKIPKGFRGQTATFGAAVTTGTLLSAILFFSQKGNAAVDRTKLMDAIYEILKQVNPGATGDAGNLYRFAVKEINSTKGDTAVKELILDAAIALKLAMNLYELDESGNEEEGGA